MSDSERTWPSRAPLLALSLLVATAVALPLPRLALTATVALCLVVALVRTRGGPAEAPRVALLAVIAALAPLAVSALVLPFGLAEQQGAGLALGVLVAVSAIAAARVPRLLALHLSAVAVLHLVHLAAPHRPIDVAVFVEESTAALLRGHNPYSLTFANPYDAAETARVWAPELVDGDRITIGFPYLPGALVGYLPGQLLPDVRLVSLAALLAATFLAWRLTSDHVGRLLVAAMPATPLALLTTTYYWVEPLLVLAVALLGWAIVRGSRRWGAVAVAVLLSVKQYALVWLLLERLVRRRLGAAPVLAGAAAAGLLIVTFFLVAPADFWRSVVSAQFLQPYRPDSVSLAVDLVELGLPVPAVALSIGSLVAGTAAAWWVRATAPATATWTVLGIGLSLLATVLMSKQAFVNYYCVIGACLVVGVATWPRDASVPRSAERTPD